MSRKPLHHASHGPPPHRLRRQGGLVLPLRSSHAPLPPPCPRLAPSRRRAGLRGGDSHWLYRGSDIAPDSSWTFGTLPNGLRYAVRRNANPAGQVSVRLRMDVGSLMEAQPERGWAHFIEHMVFRGTEHFGDGEARETWQRLGASFGSDTNATTDATQTVFMLDLPHADRASLDTSLALLAEMTDKARFDPAIVDRPSAESSSPSAAAGASSTSSSGTRCGRSSSPAPNMPTATRSARPRPCRAPTRRG
jgi:hypothetical protein